MLSASSARMLVIVPAWNEQETVAGVVSELRSAVPGADVLVVDDGSADRTAEEADRAGALVLELPINLGVGGAMRAGYTYAMRHGYDLAVQVDADGQHDPREIPNLLARMDEEQADIVIGARFAGVGSYEARGPRRWSMRMLAAVLSRVCRTRLTDATSGFKLSNRRAITLFSGNYPAEYLGDTVESLVIAARAGLVVRQVGVAMRPRAGGTPSHSPVRAAVFLGRAALALVIALSRPTVPAQPALDIEAPA
ncbi:glycosyltransferase family 2 protein [Cellulomonas pakistanensis]|uniref:Glycosyl transferase family 2 n=1 Tax=Cellulomonas pakistanensis TaxID=992287 RepID=A0A919U3A5_9CELL|nr:glycosyltransferase family 2 protein [Cellulomonas pakistanensis]GIG36086.1 glycosyl transferase family 2 [Cellulomonas pakistanensis]